MIQILNKIKINLDYLRKKSLNKDYTKTMENYLKESINEAEKIGNLEKKTILENLRKIYSQLIEIENVDINELTDEKYKEIKDKIMNS